MIAFEHISVGKRRVISVLHLDAHVVRFAISQTVDCLDLICFMCFLYEAEIAAYNKGDI